MLILFKVIHKDVLTAGSKPYEKYGLSFVIFYVVFFPCLWIQFGLFLQN